LDEVARCAPYLVSSAVTLADLHAYPMLRYLTLAPEGAALLGSQVKLWRWLDVMHSRRSVQNTKSPLEP
jgi:glutathione S-transferase